MGIVIEATFKRELLDDSEMKELDDSYAKAPIQMKFSVLMKFLGNGYVYTRLIKKGVDPSLDRLYQVDLKRPIVRTDKSGIKLTGSVTLRFISEKGDKLYIAELCTKQGYIDLDLVTYGKWYKACFWFFISITSFVAIASALYQGLLKSITFGIGLGILFALPIVYHEGTMGELISERTRRGMTNKFITEDSPFTLDMEVI